jgi:predicted N-acyltransferase
VSGIDWSQLYERRKTIAKNFGEIWQIPIARRYYKVLRTLRGDSVSLLEVTAIYRLYHDSILKKLIKRMLMYPIFRVLGIDFAHQIIVIGRKPVSQPVSQQIPNEKMS